MHCAGNGNRYDFFFSSRRRHTRIDCDWSSDVCSSDLRARNDLVVFDCGAVPPNLIESELFGHEKGSFTGAIMTRQGLFEMANGGNPFFLALRALPPNLPPKPAGPPRAPAIPRAGTEPPAPADGAHHPRTPPHPP